MGMKLIARSNKEDEVFQVVFTRPFPEEAMVVLNRIFNSHFNVEVQTPDEKTIVWNCRLTAGEVVSDETMDFIGNGFVIAGIDGFTGRLL